jgi:hypothetical protein
MRRFMALLAVVGIAVAACETQVPTASQQEVRAAVYPGADIVRKGIEYSAIAPSEMEGGECQWMVDGDAMVSFWSRPDCETNQGITMWIEYTARLTPGVWRIGLNAINTGAGLGDDPTWYPEFFVRSNLTPETIRIRASDTEVNSGYTEYTVTSPGDYTVGFWWMNDQSDVESDPPRDANIEIVSVFFDKVGGGGGGRPIQWSVLDLPCPEGTDPVDGQVQAAVPLGPASGLVLIGTSTVCRGGTEPSYWTPDWFVYDISSGSAVLVDAFDTEAAGFNLGVHSPVNSRVAFGVDGTVLTTYDNGFHKVDLPAGVWGIDVWAASPRAVWIAGSSEPWDPYYPWTTGGPGKIIRFDGEAFVVEYDGGSPVLDIWGFGPRAMFASAMTGILQRRPDGTWTDVDLPDACGGTYSGDVLVGLNPRDVWAARYTCLLHFDGESWRTVAVPVSGNPASPMWVQAVLPLSATSVLIAGQGSVPAPDYIALWGSADRGQTWSQIHDPVFASLPLGSQYRTFFAMDATPGGTRMFLPPIRGAKLFVGTPMDFAAIGGHGSDQHAGGAAATPTVIAH